MDSGGQIGSRQVSGGHIGSGHTWVDRSEAFDVHGVSKYTVASNMIRSRINYREIGSIEKDGNTKLGGCSGGAMALGNLPVPGRPTIWIIVGQGPTALAVGAGGCCLDIFTLIYPFSPLSPSLRETARYRRKYCLKRPLNPRQPTNQHQTGIPTRYISCLQNIPL